MDGAANPFLTPFARVTATANGVEIGYRLLPGRKHLDGAASGVPPKTRLDAGEVLVLFAPPPNVEITIRRLVGC